MDIIDCVTVSNYFEAVICQEVATPSSQPRALRTKERQVNDVNDMSLFCRYRNRRRNPSDQSGNFRLLDRVRLARIIYNVKIRPYRQILVDAKDNTLPVPLIQQESGTKD